MPEVIAVASSATHSFSKPTRPEIELVEGVGVLGDAHSGATVKHEFLAKKDATRPNLRQVHLIHAELLDEVAADGFQVAPGELGENICTRGIDLLGLPEGTELRLGERAVVTITGLRSPCHQINDFQPGLLAKMLRKDESGEVQRLSGVMAVVTTSGTVRPGDRISVAFPAEPHRRLAPV